jgi:hypothetical protein
MFVKFRFSSTLMAVGVIEKVTVVCLRISEHRVDSVAERTGPGPLLGTSSPLQCLTAEI